MSKDKTGGREILKFKQTARPSTGQEMQVSGSVVEGLPSIPEALCSIST